MFRISTKHQLQNVNQTSAPRLNLELQNVDQIFGQAPLPHLDKIQKNSSFSFGDRQKGDHSSIWFTIKAIVADQSPIPLNIY